MNPSSNVTLLQENKTFVSVIVSGLHLTDNLNEKVSSLIRTEECMIISIDGSVAKHANNI